MSTNSKIKITDVLIPGLLGCYLLFGAIYSFFTTKWFVGFPPQLDIVLVLGSPLGLYFEALIATLMGCALIFLAGHLWRKMQLNSSFKRDA